MGDSKKLKKSWYELPDQKEFVMRTSREGPRAFLWNLWTPKVIFGKAGLGFLSIILKEQFDIEDQRVIIVADPYLKKISARVEKSFQARGFKTRIWDGIQSEVPIETVQEGVKVCEMFKPKILVAVGGGSALDTAKMVFLMYEKPDVDIYSLIPINALGLRKKIKLLIAIPTTSGTGSEATFGSMVKDTTQNPPKKINVAIMELLPDIAILGYEFVKDMPPKLTAGTGIDALVHAISAYMSSCHNTVGDINTLAAVELITKFLPRAYKRGNDMEAREKMQIGAFYAGLSICNVGISFDHGLGHSLGTLFPIHHGVSVGIFLPYVLQYLSKNTNRYIEIAIKFGIKTKKREDQEILDDLVYEYKKLCNLLNLPTSVKDIKEPRISKDEYMEKLEQLVELAWDDISNFDNIRVPNKDDLKRIFIYAYDGTDVDF